MNRKERKQKIIKLRNDRYTYEVIGKMFSLTRQRVHQIVNGRPRENIPFTEIPKDWESTGVYNSSGLDKEGFKGRDFLKEQVRRRDNFTCQICDKKWEKGTRRLDVHHLDPKLEGVNGYSYESCKNLDEMITLCHKCHMRLPHIRKKIASGQKKFST